jgi:hypothetical protein
MNRGAAASLVGTLVSSILSTEIGKKGVAEVSKIA